MVEASGYLCVLCCGLGWLVCLLVAPLSGGRGSPPGGGCGVCGCGAGFRVVWWVGGCVGVVVGRGDLGGRPLLLGDPSPPLILPLPLPLPLTLTPVVKVGMSDGNDDIGVPLPLIDIDAGIVLVILPTIPPIEGLVIPPPPPPSPSPLTS